MEIPRSLLDSLSNAVNLLSDAAQAQASAAIGRLLDAWDGEDVSALRTACIEVLSPLCAEFADLTAALGAEFYDEVRGMSGAKGTFKARVESGFDPDAYEGGVRAMMDVLVKDRAATDRFEREMLDRVDEECRRGANRCVAKNARRDKLKPKFARVPSGADTCPFCLMLASRGFVYTSEDAASHAHRHCDCRVVPQFDGASVAGYDPDLCYEMWKHPERFEATGDRSVRSGKPFSWRNEAVEALSSPEEVAAYLLEKHGVTAQESFSALSLDKQKAAAAAFDRGSELFGKAEVHFIAAEKRLSMNAEGEYQWNSGKVVLKNGVADAYLTAFHEYVHGVDAYRSSKMDGYLSTPGIAGTTLYSKKVVKDVLRKLGMRRDGRKLRDEISKISGLDFDLLDEIMKNDYEIMAYSLEYFESGRIDEFRQAIFEEATK